MKLILLIMTLFAVYLSTNIFVTSPNPYATAYGSPPAQQVIEVDTPAFVRGNTKNEPIDWRKNPCRDSRTSQYYESEMISREEIEYNLQLVGFTPEQSRVMQAIVKAESSQQINCYGDENLANSKWDISYGLFQIRGLVAERGRGSCRDVERLRLNIVEQSKCAYEISGGGTNFRPWSMYLNGRYRRWL